jgi:hypothetical protein
MDFHRHKSDARFRLDKTLFPVNELMILEFMLAAVGLLGQSAGSPALKMLFPKGTLSLQLL